MNEYFYFHEKDYKNEISIKNVRLKILKIYAGPFPRYQGTQCYIRHLSESLADVGVSVELMCYGGGFFSDAKALPYRVVSSFPWFLPSRSGPSWGKVPANAAVLMGALFKCLSGSFDVIHAHGYEALLIALLLKKACKIPVVFHAHHVMGYELPGYCRSVLARHVMQYLGDSLDTLFPKHADAVVVFDQDHKAFYAMEGVDESRMHVVPAAVNPLEMHEKASVLETVGSVKALLPLKRYWFLYAGNPDHYQNLDLLWRAFALVHMRFPDVGLLVASPHKASSFQSPAFDALGSEHVHVVQYRSLDELNALHRIADAGVCPRVTWTGVPIKVLHYLAAGLPVVACRSACKHILTPHEGILTHPDPHVFAEAMCSLVMGKGPKKTRLPEKYCIQNQVESMLRVYQSVSGV